jgi:hypothetical protein
LSKTIKKRREKEKVMEEGTMNERKRKLETKNGV